MAQLEGKMYYCNKCGQEMVDSGHRCAVQSERLTSVVRSNATEVEDLKCCGNCLHRSTIDMGSYSDETCDKDNNLSSWQYCKKWEFDGIERSGRTEGFDVK